MKAFTVDGHSYFWAREAETVLVWDSTDTLIGTAQPDVEELFWVLENTEGDVLAKLNFYACTESEVARALAAIAANEH